MINLGIILKLQPHELANTFCHLAHDCRHCPVYDYRLPDTRDCRKLLVKWLMTEEDKEFWRWLRE